MSPKNRLTRGWARSRKRVDEGVTHDNRAGLGSGWCGSRKSRIDSKDALASCPGHVAAPPGERMSASSSTDCTALATSISAYLDGELQGVECNAIERHCAACPRCAAVVEGLRHTIGLCRGVGIASLPESVRERARENVRRLLDAEERAPSE